MLTIEKETAAIEFAASLLEVFCISMDVVSVNVLNHVDTIWGKAGTDVLKKADPSFVVMQTVIND